MARIISKNRKIRRERETRVRTRINRKQRKMARERMLVFLRSQTLKLCWTKTI